MRWDYLRVCKEGRNWFGEDFPNRMQETPRSYLPENRGTVEEVRANKEEARKNAAEADKAKERPSAEQ